MGKSIYGCCGENKIELLASIFTSTFRQGIVPVILLQQRWIGSKRPAWVPDQSVQSWSKTLSKKDHFKDKTAIVTGGASGIGQAICEQLGQRGAQVIVADINGTSAKEVAFRIAADGGQARAAQVDVRRYDDVLKLVNQTRSHAGRLDFMFNNAGATICGEVRDMEISHWKRMFDVNLWGVIHGTKAAYQVMLEQGFGHIVNTASLDGLMPMPMATPYTSAKHAVVGLSTAVRLEAAGLGVKVSVACPGAVKTGVLDAAEFVAVQREGAIDEMSAFKMMDADVCARAILRGVKRNQAIILDGAIHNLLFWWLYRISPNAYSALMRVGVSEIRKHRVAGCNKSMEW